MANPNPMSSPTPTPTPTSSSSLLPATTCTPLSTTLSNTQTLPATHPRLYFGYGSNLWRQQMSRRCPGSRLMGIGRLRGFRWIINGRGYANVVCVGGGAAAEDHRVMEEEEKRGAEAEVVWGLVYALEGDDEERLDVNEGVPFAYEKEDLEIEFWPLSLSVSSTSTSSSPSLESSIPSSSSPLQPTPTPTLTKMLVYVDHQRTEPSAPKDEYVYRMNMGIKDAVALGVPMEWVEEVVLRFIPGTEGEPGDDGVREKAERQAGRFVEEEEVDK